MKPAPVSILIADDDEEDRQLIREAFEESRVLNPLHFVNDGEQLMARLAGSQLPGLILLDLNMPKMDGREALREIKSNPKLKSIPVIILTTSQAEEDIYRTYNLGVNSFITKPVSFSSLVAVLNKVAQYWFEIVQLPAPRSEKD